MKLADFVRTLLKESEGEVDLYESCFTDSKVWKILDDGKNEDGISNSEHGAVYMPLHSFHSPTPHWEMDPQFSLNFDGIICQANFRKCGQKLFRSALCRAEIWCVSNLGT